MNWENSSKLLSDLNEQEKYRHIPIAVFLGLVGITGLIGNSVVCYIYGAVYTQSNSRIFLICLAGIDLCTCIIDIPLEIINVLNQYEFSEPLLCKFSRSGNTLTTFYSTGILLSIAIDRHRKICHPHGFQISNKIAKYLCVVLFFGTLIMTWPALFMYGIKSTKFDYHDFELTRRECSIDDTYDDSIYPLIYNFIVLLLFIVALSVLIVLYFLIGRKVRFFAYKNERRRSVSNFDSDGDTIDDVQRKTHLKNLHQAAASSNTAEQNQYVQMSKDEEGKQFQVKEENPCDKDEDCSVTKSKSFDSITTLGTLDKKNAFKHQASTAQLNIIKRRRMLARNTTYLMFIVTFSFIIASLPYLVLVILDNVITDFVENMNANSRATYRFFLRSYFLGAALNPIIYSIFDRRFRYACKNIVKNVKMTMCNSATHDIA